MLSVVLLLLQLRAIHASVCFGPCNGPVYETTRVDSLFRVECSRNYKAKLSSSSCITEMKIAWDLNTPAVNQFAEMSTAYNNGRQAAEKACEEVCASTNSCTAFGVSSDAHVAEQKWQCVVYYACPSKQFNEHVDLYEREAPFNCFAKATTHKGVYVNYLETNGIVTQTGRSLQFPLEKFFDVHLRVNGVFNKSDLAYRPYRPAPLYLCEAVDSDCVIMRAGRYSVLVVSLFVLIVAFNSCVLWVSLTKGLNSSEKKATLFQGSKVRKKESAMMKRRKQVGSSNMFF